MYRSYRPVVKTQDFDSCNLGSNPSRTLLLFFFFLIFFVTNILFFGQKKYLTSAIDSVILFCMTIQSHLFLVHSCVFILFVPSNGQQQRSQATPPQCGVRLASGSKDLNKGGQHQHLQTLNGHKTIRLLLDFNKQVKAVAVITALRRIV